MEIPDFSAALNASVAPASPNIGPKVRRRSLLGTADWPILGADALYGLPGQVVRAISPHTEADEANILMQFLPMFGNACGSHACARAEARRHPMKVNAVAVGDTASAKGSAAAHCEELMALIDPGWVNKCMTEGLSSGEGLVSAVRDPDDPDEPIVERRAMFIESEFGGTLSMMSRDGNSLSKYVRQLWDGSCVRVATKTPLKASAAYVSIVGHVTPFELRKNLTGTDAVNGFANRFLWVLVRRARELPDGGDTPHYGTLIARLRTVLAFAQHADPNRPLQRDHNARRLWDAEYSALTAPRQEPIASIISRARAQVLRLSLIYAVMDQSKEIRDEHLRAAFAVWRYCEASASVIFGGQMVASTPAKIIHALQEAGRGGLSQTEISAVFGRNLRGLKDELAQLEEDGLIFHRNAPPARGGTKPRTIYYTE